MSNQEAMVAKMRNAGEACTAANRFYVQAGIHDAFVQGLTQRMAALKVGPGTDSDSQVGPMITPPLRSAKFIAW